MESKLVYIGKKSLKDIIKSPVKYEEGLMFSNEDNGHVCVFLNNGIYDTNTGHCIHEFTKPNNFAEFYFGG
jgi:hypothetical protein